MKRLISVVLLFSLCLNLCGCGKSGKYESAVALMDAGNYEEAIVVFTELGDYEDSIQKLEECYNNIAYNNAIALIAEGAYVEAWEIFETIPDFKDVSEYLARYQTIDITPANWDKYFEIIDIPIFVDDDFEEVEQIVFSYCVVLKEPYVPQLCVRDALEVIFKVEYDYYDVPLSVDTNAHTFNYIENETSARRHEAKTAKFTEDSLGRDSIGYILAENDDLSSLIQKENTLVAVSARYHSSVNEWGYKLILENIVVTKSSGSITLFE